MNLSISSVRYPTLSRYLNNLPQSVNSYPDVQTVGELLNTQLTHFPQLKQVRDLPPEVMRIVQRTYGSHEWVPEVHLMCISALVRDVVCRSDEAYLQNRYDIIRQTVKSGFFRAVFSVLSPSLLALSAERHWRSMKRGVELTTMSTGKQERTLKLTYPANLYLSCLVEGIAKSFEGLLSMSHAKEPTSETKVISPTESHLVLRWKV